MPLQALSKARRRGVYETHPRAAAESSRVIVDILKALGLANGQDTRVRVEEFSPIPNGARTVAKIVY